jgi:hypothetical protein
VFRYGAGTNGVMRTLGQYMLTSGATFGYDSWRLPSPTAMILPANSSLALPRFFMSIGSVIRTDSPTMISRVYYEAQRRRTPIIVQQTRHAFRRKDDE